MVAVLIHACKIHSMALVGDSQYVKRPHKQMIIPHTPCKVM